MFGLIHLPSVTVFLSYLRWQEFVEQIHIETEADLVNCFLTGDTNWYLCTYLYIQLKGTLKVAIC